MSDKFKKRLGMGFGYVGSSQMFLIVSAYLTYFYTNVVGLSAGIIGTIFLVSRVLDGLSDIVFGNVIDKTRTKMGVARPWVLRMSIFGFLGILGLFCVPHVGDTAKYLYVFISYNVANAVIATLYQLSTMTLPTYMTRDQTERGILYICANTGNFLVQFILSTFMFRIVTSLGGDQRAWILATGGVAFVGMLFAMLCVVLCKEEVDPDEIAKTAGIEAKVPFLKALKAVVSNKYWWMILGFVTLGTGVYSGTAMITPYYSQYVLGNTTLADTLNSCFAFPMMIMTPCLGFIIAKVGKRNIALFGSCSIVVGSVVAALFPNSLPMLCCAQVFKSIGVGCPTAVYAAMLADSIEYGQWKTGIRAQAVTMGAQSAGGKIGAGLITTAITWILQAVGFNGSIAIQNESTINAIQKMYSILPLCLAACMVLILVVYDLDKRYPSIMADLKKREGRE
ncbi:MAG: MFS transporter [Oscillospiraceae bacterium]|nr:MFS transporter [Oscillospiraceae bacterium]